MKRPTATRTDEPTVAPARYSGRSGWTSARSRAAPRTMSTAGRTIVHTIVAYPTTRLESQRLHTRSVVVHPAIHATPSPRANARASGHAEDHRSSGVSALTPIRLVEADEVTSRGGRGRRGRQGDRGNFTSATSTSSTTSTTSALKTSTP